MYSIVEPHRSMSLLEMALGLSGLALAFGCFREHAATKGASPLPLVGSFAGLGMMALAAFVGARRKRKAERAAHPPST